MSRFVSVAILAVAFGALCCCNSSSLPPLMSPPLALAIRIQPPDPSKYATYEDVPWNEWKNPRVIVTSEGIKVLLSGTSNGSTVQPERVGDVLAKTTSSDWPPRIGDHVTMLGLGIGRVESKVQYFGQVL